jgi:hypothetical protein
MTYLDLAHNFLSGRAHIVERFMLIDQKMKKEVAR